MVQNESEHLSPVTYCQQHRQQRCWRIAGNCSVFFPYFVFAGNFLEGGGREEGEKESAGDGRKEGRKVGEGYGCPRLRVLSPSPPGGIGGVEGVKLLLANYYIESCIYVSKYQY